ncbi:manganese catalase family protein [Dongia soli]|uniref:Manganese catalase family protein n=1 Tax=Dongia soli TaxID=600628 RepID=A0ABU5EE76_9PROT|nr:manganese catalase family protein [Dongia soli]MDY0884654.1 manganese catalase family protein [Dongia soli]
MYMHNKRLMYTVRVSEPNPRLATLMLEQFGGPQGELAAAIRYFTQALSENDPGRKDMLHDIATEELSHLEVIGNIVVMLNKGVKAKMAEGVEVGELMSDVFHGGESHLTSLLYGGGAALVNSGGVPWTAAYVDSIGDPTCDLRSNIAAEARAKIVYERLINVTDDPGVKDALGFLMTREIAHQKSFEKALYSIRPNFPPGKLPGKEEFASTYFNMSMGEGDMRGPWNQGEQWDYEPGDAQPSDAAADIGTATVELGETDLALDEALTARTASLTDIDPVTGADLGAGPGAGRTKPVDELLDDELVEGA